MPTSVSYKGIDYDLKIGKDVLHFHSLENCVAETAMRRCRTSNLRNGKISSIHRLQYTSIVSSYCSICTAIVLFHAETDTSLKIPREKKTAKERGRLTKASHWH